MHSISIMHLIQPLIVLAGLLSVVASCAVRSVGVGTCASQCTAPLHAFNQSCPAHQVCCIRPHDPSKHQSAFYQQRCASSGAEPGTCPFLDDIYCQKTFPSIAHAQWREFQCPNRFDEANLIGFSDAVLHVSQIVVNTTALLPYVDTDFFHISLILIRRDQSGNPYFKYLSNGNERVLVQPWSSSKPFAAINAASTLRAACPSVGFEAAELESGNKLGDLSTIVHSYDTTHNMSSNCLAGYFHDIGGHVKLDQNLHSWLGVSDQESLGGKYGCNDDYGMGEQFQGIETSYQQCKVQMDTPTPILTNRLSMLSASEFYKRMMMTRENPAFAYPNTTWHDVRELMYGPQQSSMFPDNIWGGATTDTAILAQSGLDLNRIETDSLGQWRIISKLGAGQGDARPVGREFEIVNHAYACMPVIDRATGRAVLNSGVEFVFSAFAADSAMCVTDEKFQRNIASVMKALMSNNGLW